MIKAAAAALLRAPPPLPVSGASPLAVLAAAFLWLWDQMGSIDPGAADRAALSQSQSEISARIDELAQMMGTLSDNTRLSAQELLDTAAINRGDKPAAKQLAF